MLLSEELRSSRILLDLSGAYILTTTHSHVRIADLFFAFSISSENSESRAMPRLSPPTELSSPFYYRPVQVRRGLQGEQPAEVLQDWVQKDLF